MTQRIHDRAHGNDSHGRALTSDNPRRVAYDVLTAVSDDEAYANLVLPRLLSEQGIEGRDAAFATELTYGTCRMRGTLDTIISSAANRDIDKIDTAVLNVLRVGAYQLLCTRVAAHAAVDTTVSLAREAIGHKPAGFVNAVMRKISRRDSDGWIDALLTGDPTTDMSLEYSHPEWIVRRLEQSLPIKTDLGKALAANNIAPEVHLCAKPGRISPQDLARYVHGETGRYSPHTVYLHDGNPGHITEIRNRDAHVQDEGSQLVAAALADAPLQGNDTRWLDLCAGPGGKAALLGALAAERGARVTAVEVAAHRASLTRQAVSRLPVTVVNEDGRQFSDDQLFDRVLVDVPCSGLGALRRRPEARWRRQEADLDALLPLQRELLVSALSLTRPGGVVAYVTCSPVLAETREIVASVVGDRELIDASTVLPSTLPGLDDGPFVQLWPHLHGTDAMFCALIRA